MTVKGTQARAGAKVPTHGSLPHLPPKAIIANPKRQQIWLPSFFVLKRGLYHCRLFPTKTTANFAVVFFLYIPPKFYGTASASGSDPRFWAIRTDCGLQIFAPLPWQLPRNPLKIHPKNHTVLLLTPLSSNLYIEQIMKKHLDIVSLWVLPIDF